MVTFGPFSFDLGARSLRKGDEELTITSGVNSQDIAIAVLDWAATQFTEGEI